jgi:hypothetical protein
MSNMRVSSLLSLLAGVAMIVTMAASALSFSVPTAGAQVLTENELFGGNTNGEAFASEAGLGSGDLVTTIANIIRVVLGFLGVVAVFIILLGGFKWMTSGGADEKVRDAKKLMISGVIGLAIVLSAYAIASFVIGSLTGAIANSEA